MFFIGDIAQPYLGASSYLISEELKTKTWFGNLEGSLIDGNYKKNDIRGVYNDVEAIKGLCKEIPFVAFNIANNHLLDAAGVKTTLDNAELLGLPVVGAGLDLHKAQKARVITDKNGINYRIVSFGWENIQCISAEKNKQGVNPYTRKNVIRCAEEALQHKERVVCFMHWNYELEAYPQPYDRQLAKDLIDMGVAAVIGCHAHRTQPIDFYKGKPIVYGLGNFLFCQGHYFGGKLCFPKFCEEEYAFELTKDGYWLHYFHYDQQANRLEYVKSAEISEDREFEGKAVFTGYTNEEYEQFFEKNRIQKKLLPIFHSNESAVSYWVKSEWIKLRGCLLDMATKMNVKSASRKER